MQQILAIIVVSWKAAFRYRLFWVLAFLLVLAVAALPVLVKDDGTAEGFTQIVLTYTLGSVTAILGICTLWLACGSLARDIEECQIQMVAVKPIGRWRIWLGKWLGIVTLDAALLALAGLSIALLLQWRASKLPAEQQERLKSQVLVARGSARERDLTPVIEQESERIFKERKNKVGLEGVDEQKARDQIREQIKAEIQVVGPDQIRPWQIHIGATRESLKDQVLFLRVKFNAADAGASGTYYGQWQVGTPPGVAQPWMSEIMSLAPDTFHEFPIPPNLIDANGDLIVAFHNPNSSALLFPIGEGLEVLYREGGFTFNYVRGLAIILCWMSLLAALGLTAGSFLSFPVAAFLSLAVLTIGLSSGTLSNVVEEGTILGRAEEKSVPGHTAIDAVAVPAFKAVLNLVQMVQQFSPIDSLSTGRTITGKELARAFGEVVLLLGGAIGVIGVIVFSRRELATAQGNS